MAKKNKRLSTGYGSWSGDYDDSVTPVGKKSKGTYRGIGSSLFNARNIALEDYQRQLNMNNVTNNFNAEQAQIARDFEAEQAQIVRDFNAEEAEKNRAFNAQEAEKNRAWQENLSNTAITRAVADMKNAGINPILAYSSSASTPAGGVAGGSSASASNPSTASASSSSTSFRSNSTDPITEVLDTAVKVIAGLVLKQPSKTFNINVK